MENENNLPENQTNPPDTTQTTPTTTETPPQTPVETPEPTPRPGEVVTSNRKRSKLWLLLVILFLVAGGVGAYLMLNKPESPEQAAAVNHDIAVLRYGTDANPLNVFYPNSSNKSHQIEINNQIFEGLVKYENLTQIAPAVATGWSNPDTSTWIFEIRPNLKFHNGRTVTAAAVKDSLDYILNHPELENAAAATIKSISTVGSDKVKIVTDGPDPVLLNKLAALYIFDTTAKQLGDPTTGTGPYTLKPGTTPSATKFELVADDNYYGGHIATRELQFVSQPIEQLIKSYQDGKIDIIGQNLEKEPLTKLKDYQNINNPNTYVYYLGLNSAKAGSPLAKREVRQAISLALDRSKIVKISGGEVINQLIPPTIPGYNPNITVPKQDVTKAKSLLATAGYPNGFTLELTHTQVREALISQITTQLSTVGIKIKPNVSANDDNFYDTALGGKTDIFYIAYSSDYLDGADVLSSTLNSPNYNNQKLFDEIDALATEIDGSIRLKTLQKLSKQAADDYAMIPLFAPAQSSVVRSNFNLKIDTPNTLTGIYFYKVSQK
jgi:peptide/nickel transport system substrate-binding protein